MDSLQTPRPGWGVMTVFRNGLRRVATLHNTGITPAFQLVLADGSVMKVHWMPGGIGDRDVGRSARLRPAAEGPPGGVRLLSRR